MKDKENQEANNNVKKKLLALSNEEINERVRALEYYNFYKGKSSDIELAKATKDSVLLGQNWLVNDDLDYTPTQCISNKVKSLLKKQSRWMFGKIPGIVIKADIMNKENKELCEELRKYIEDILNNRFWKETKQAFLETTIKKRVACRIAASPTSKYLRIRYDSIDNVSYKEIDGVITEIKYFAEDLGNGNKETNDKVYYIYKYYYKDIEGEDGINRKAYFSKYTYKGNDLENPIKEDEEILKNSHHELGFDINKLPCWVIKNEPSMSEPYGESDLEDLIDLQNERNRKLSDYADALKFQMFGAVGVIDGSEETVNSMTVAPGAKWAIKTREELANNGKQASLKIQEYNIGNSEALTNYLNILETDMKAALDMPDIKDLTNIPSAKAIKYLNNDLIDRCEGKWTDWEPFLLEVIDYILHISSEMKLKGWDDRFSNLIDKCTISFKHNYPLPEDEAEEKELALKEVDGNVRSKKSYLKEYSKEEDAEEAYKEILNEKSLEADVSFGSLGNPDNYGKNTNKSKEEEIDE